MASSLHVPAALLILLLLPAIVVQSQPSPSSTTTNNTFPAIVVQPSPSSSNNNNHDNNNSYNNFGTANFTSSTAVVIVVLLSAFFFLAFFSIYIRQCSLGRSSNIHSGVTARVFAEGAAARRGRGLDASILETFPTFPYSEVKELKFGKETLECAVCLSEFSDDETLRLLPACSHVFHPDCIDVWLASHVTCPVCRTNLAAPPESPVEEESSPVDDVAITVEDEAAILPRRFGRSHTTGHSVAASPAEGACVDRHTLRLPEHVRKVIMEAGKFRRATSCVGFAEGGEASARRGYRSMGARSERWGAAFLARAMSMRVPAWAVRRGEGEESVKKGEGSFRRGAFDCLGGGTSATTEEEESSTVAFARV